MRARTRNARVVCSGCTDFWVVWWQNRQLQRSDAKICRMPNSQTPCTLYNCMASGWRSSCQRKYGRFYTQKIAATQLASAVENAVDPCLLVLRGLRSCFMGSVEVPHVGMAKPGVLPQHEQPTENWPTADGGEPGGGKGNKAGGSFPALYTARYALTSAHLAGPERPF